MSRVVWVGVLSLATFAAAAPVQPSDDAEALTLEDAVRIAQAQTADVLSARQDILLADVNRIAALAPILPQLNLTSNAGSQFAVRQTLEIRQNNAGAFINGIPNTITYGEFVDVHADTYSTPQFSAQLQASQLIFDGGKWWTVLAQADDVSAQAQAAFRRVQNDVRDNAARAFYTLEKATRGVATFEEQIKLDTEQLDRVNGLMRAGAGKPADVAAVERNLASDRSKLKQQAYTERQARRSLNLALGRSADKPLRLIIPEELSAQGPLQPISLPPRDKLVADAKQSRPELEFQRAVVESDRKSVTIAQADYYPVLSAGATYTRNSRRPDRVYAADPTSDFYANLGFSLTWNLFSGRATTANVQKQEIQLAKDEIAYLNTERSVLGDLDDKIEGVETTAAVYSLSVETIRAAEEAVRLARGNYEQGKGTLLELRDAEVQLTLARLNADEARLDLEIAREDLRHAVGADPFEVTTKEPR
jgi:outer membrane protein TolC